VTPARIVIGTRGSQLALWQTHHVADQLRAAHAGLQVEVVVISTKGDRVLDTPLPLVGGKGVFTEELEAALRSGAIDLAVHSLKDLPTVESDGLTVGAVLEREDPSDVLVSRTGAGLASLPDGAVIGTSSTRRASQLLHARPRLRLRDIRGNVDTRLSKLHAPDSPYDAIVLAMAGLVRLGRAAAISEALPFEVMLPAPAQGALAVQCRDEAVLRAALAPLHHAPTACAVAAERGFLNGLGGGCSVPVAALMRQTEAGVKLSARVGSPDGLHQWQATYTRPSLTDEAEAWAWGVGLAQDALSDGVANLLGVPR
jgi:hydroxymethylbilane synthase